jgi:hypothetical protein
VDSVERRRAADPYTYTQLDRYYSGRQPLSFLPPDVAQATMGRLRPLLINWPRLVIDTIEERLDVEGFRFGNDLPADSRCWDIWQANNLDEWSQQCHLEALLHGRSYVLVWADEIDNSQPRISVESSQQMSVVYYPGTSTIAHATKRWVEGDTAFMTVYRPDSIERYVASTATCRRFVDDGERVGVARGAVEPRSRRGSGRPVREPAAHRASAR